MQESDSALIAEAKRKVGSGERLDLEALFQSTVIKAIKEKAKDYGVTSIVVVESFGLDLFVVSLLNDNPTSRIVRHLELKAWYGQRPAIPYTDVQERLLLLSENEKRVLEPVIRWCIAIFKYDKGQGKCIDGGADEPRYRLLTHSRVSALRTEDRTNRANHNLSATNVKAEPGISWDEMLKQLCSFLFTPDA